MASRGAMSVEQRDLLYLFERPLDPLYMPRASSNVVYDLPTDKVVSGVVLVLLIKL